MHGLSLVVASVGPSLVVMHTLAVVVASLIAEHRLEVQVFSSCIVQSQWLWLTGLVALQHVGPSPFRG